MSMNPAALLTAFFPLWFGWLLFTQTRRHRVREARAILANAEASGGNR